MKNMIPIPYEPLPPLELFKTDKTVPCYSNLHEDCVGGAGCKCECHKRD